MTRTRATLCALALASSVLASCSNDVQQLPTVVQSTKQVTSAERTQPYTWLPTVLPTGDELSKAVGRRVRVDSIPPLLGSVDDLRNTVAGTEATKSQCTGVISPLERQVYADSPVSAVTYSTQSTITTGAVLLSSTSDAQTLFATLSDQWRGCDGTSYTATTGGLRFEYEIGDVRPTTNVVSAIVLVTSAPGGVAVPTERALGVARDCIVEAEVPVAVSSSNGLDSRTAATDLVEIMLSKANAHR